MTRLAERRCDRSVTLLNDIEIQQYRSELDTSWNIAGDRRSISRQVSLGNYDEILRLVNAVTDIARDQDHHPDICFSYNTCDITYSTHSVGGLSLNDFICAARIDQIDTLS